MDRHDYYLSMRKCVAFRGNRETKISVGSRARVARSLSVVLQLTESHCNDLSRP